MTDRGPAWRIIRAHRPRLLATYGLFGLEMLTSLLRPYLLGVAVDGLLVGQLRGLLALSAAHLAYLLIGTMRHMVDTRTFSSIYTSYVTEWLGQPADEHDLSRRSALATLSRQLTDFLEYDVNYVTEALYNIVGSLVLLLVYDRTVVSLCLAIMVPVVALARRYGRAATRINRAQFDDLEQQVDVIASRDPGLITTHYRRLRASQVKLSDLEAWNFGVTELCVLAVVAGALLIATGDGRMLMPVGSIIGMYTYVLRFASGLETIPYMMQRLGALRDIVRRVAVPDTLAPRSD